MNITVCLFTLWCGNAPWSPVCLQCDKATQQSTTDTVHQQNHTLTATQTTCLCVPRFNSLRFFSCVCHISGLCTQNQINKSHQSSASHRSPSSRAEKCKQYKTNPQKTILLTVIYMRVLYIQQTKKINKQKKKSDTDSFHSLVKASLDFFFWWCGGHLRYIAVYMQICSQITSASGLSNHNLDCLDLN